MNSRILKKYRIKDKARLRELYYFAMQYPEWKKQLAEVTFIGSPNFDGMPHGTQVGNPTERIGIDTADLISKIRMIEECAHEADKSIYSAIIKGVTTPNCSYNYLESRGLAKCGRDKYYMARAKFYWLLDQRKG